MRVYLLALAASFLAGPAAADPIVAAATGLQASADSGETITVEGTRRSVRSVLQKVIAETDSDQLARFEHPVCPRIIGLPVDWAGIVDRLVRENIARAGRETETAGCQPNAVAMFVDRPHDFVTGLYEKEPSFFSMEPRQFERFAATRRAAYSWQVTETYGSMGQTLRTLATLTYADPLTGAVITTPLSRGVKRADDETGSRLKTGVREEIELSFVAIDSRRINGLTLRQLADFATMHLLLSIKPGASTQNSNSILALFEAGVTDGSRPLRMSDFDWGALRGFYGQRRNNFSAAQQRQNIAAAIAREKDE